MHAVWSTLTITDTKKLTGMDSGDIGFDDEESESNLSVDFPWEKPQHQKRHLLLVPDSQSGRDIQPSGFFLCMASVLLLSSGIVLSIASLWAMTHRVAYINLIEGNQYVAIASFGFCSAILNFPCAWIAWATHNKKRLYKFLPLLLLVLSLSLTMLSTGTCFAVVQRGKILQSNNDSPVPNQYKASLNATMFGAMNMDEEMNKKAWDYIHVKFRCCGTNRPYDWKSLPPSCCGLQTGKCKIIFRRGCLDLLLADLYSELSLTIGLNSIVFCIQILTSLFVIVLYVTERLRK